MSDDQTGTRRGRGPSFAKTEQTRRALTAAALDLFLEQGFSATRMSDVAACAGVAKGTAYLYFETKAALFEGVLREVMEQALARSPPQAPRDDESTRAFLSRTVSPILRDLQATGRIGILRLVAAEGPRFPELAAVYRTLAIEPALRIVGFLAERARARGELRSQALERHPLLLAAPAVMATLWNGLYGTERSLEVAAVFESFLDLVFGE